MFQTKRNEKPVGNTFNADENSINIIYTAVSVSNDYTKHTVRYWENPRDKDILLQ